MWTVGRHAQRLLHCTPYLQILYRAPALKMSTAAADSTTMALSTETSTTTTEFASLVPSFRLDNVPLPRRGVDYRGKIVLAPMVRSGELPSRLLALHYGADLVWGPETIDRSMIGTVEKKNPRTGCVEWSRVSNNNTKATEGEDARESIIYRIDPTRESSRLIFQIGTNNPERAVEAASLVAPYCSGIDVNAGCPKPFSTDGGMGARLLKTEEGDLLCRILRALVEKVATKHEIGISVKIRLLETPEMTAKLVNKLCKTGIIGLTIHCRTTPMRPRERAIREQLRMIGDICHAHGVACLMNGDVYSRDHGKALAEEYGVDGGMIATAAEANSSVFRSEAEGGKLPWRGVVEQYLKYAISVENKWGNTKFLLSQLMPGKDPAYAKVTQARTYKSCVEILGFGPEMMEEATKLDNILQLDVPKVTAADVKRHNKAISREQREAKLQRKRALAESNNTSHTQQLGKKGRTASPSQARSISRSPERGAEITTENEGFHGQTQGILQLAV